jgi:hypothetical protein
VTIVEDASSLLVSSRLFFAEQIVFSMPNRLDIKNKREILAHDAQHIPTKPKY